MGGGVGGDLQDACQAKKQTLAGLEINATDAAAVAEERLAGAGKDSRRGTVARDTVVPTQSSNSTSVRNRTTVPPGIWMTCPHSAMACITVRGAARAHWFEAGT